MDGLNMRRSKRFGVPRTRRRMKRARAPEREQRSSGPHGRMAMTGANSILRHAAAFLANGARARSSGRRHNLRRRQVCGGTRCACVLDLLRSTRRSDGLGPRVISIRHRERRAGHAKYAAKRGRAISAFVRDGVPRPSPDPYRGQDPERTRAHRPAVARRKDDDVTIGRQSPCWMKRRRPRLPEP